jgi:ribosomal-protein-serine acetyltransferase
MVSILIDDGLLLRSFEPEDAQELFRVVEASREHLRPWLPWVDMSTKPEHSLQFIQQSKIQQRNQEGISLGIIYNHHIIGSMGMHNWDHTLKKAQLGYWVAKEYEGKGIIQKCLAAFVDFLFNKAGLNKVEIHFMVNNQRSARVAEQAGFKVEGIIRQSYLMNGIYHDIAITGLLKKEWPGLPLSEGQKFKPT